MIEPSDILGLDLGGFRFADDEPLAGQVGVVVAYAIRHRDGVFLFDTGFGFGNAALDAYYRVDARRIGDALADVGLTTSDITTVANCHLHVDHAGQNGAFPGVPIYVQPVEWQLAHETEHTILDWIDAPDTDYQQVAGDHEPIDGITVVATPGHTAGHQSLAVRTTAGLVLLTGQAVYSAGEWRGETVAREGRSRAPDPAAYDRSVDRLRALDPAIARFAHDRFLWARSAGQNAGPCYPS
ncbi:MAG: N-acyl homoserine lactonase family protein [Chloroflexi bacterium]|nr:N-acyl homoserine lactonase family protein [Chloroflexota bacterium]